MHTRAACGVLAEDRTWARDGRRGGCRVSTAFARARHNPHSISSGPPGILATRDSKQAMRRSSKGPQTSEQTRTPSLTRPQRDPGRQDGSGGQAGEQEATEVVRPRSRLLVRDEATFTESSKTHDVLTASAPHNSAPHLLVSLFLRPSRSRNFAERSCSPRFQPGRACASSTCTPAASSVGRTSLVRPATCCSERPEADTCTCDAALY